MCEQIRIHCDNFREFFQLSDLLKVPENYWDETSISDKKSEEEIGYDPVTLFVYKDRLNNWMFCEGICSDSKVSCVQCLQETFEEYDFKSFLRKFKLKRIIYNKL